MFTLANTVSRFRFAVQAALLCGLATIAAAQTITLQSITPIPIVPSAINDAAEVAGTLYAYPYHPAIYFQGVVTDLGTFGGVCCSGARAINNAGEVAGYTPPASGGNHAFLYTAGVKRDLGTLYPGGSSLAFGINASGQVVGWSDASSQSYRAFLYSGGVMRDLGTLGGVSSQGQAIDDGGDVIGLSQIADGSWHYFVYSNGVMRDFGVDALRAINAGGQIAGVTVTGTLFIYQNGVMTKLSTPGHVANPNSINTSGQIVGSMDQTGNSSRAFLYTSASGIIDLNSLLPANSGWMLTNASGISDAGQIVGGGTYLGQYSGFLMTLAGNNPPITTAAISGPIGNNGWYLGTVSVTLNATGRGNPVASTYFSVDSAGYQLYGGPFPITGDGTHQLSYYSVSTTGSQEAARQQTIRIDTTKPVSHVAALPATGSTASFNVKWSGADALSGIANYTIFAADNGGAFVPWISGSTLTQATYIGASGHTYGFYSLATDAAGNQEAAKTSAEAVTTIPARPITRIAIQSITRIALPPGAAFFDTSAINASGDVAGSLYSSGFATHHAAVYSHGAITDLGTLGGSDSDGYAINDAGQVAGSSSTSVLFGGGPTWQAFLYAGGVMRSLGDFGGQYSSAYGINASGQVVGEAAISDTTGAAFLYSGGVMHDLGTLGGWTSRAYSINDAGEVAGFSIVPPPDFEHAFLYRNGAMHDLGGLEPGGQSIASAINASGQITGFAFGPSLSHAFLYANGVMLDLFPGDKGSSRGVAINSLGQIVGFADATGAFLYTPATGGVDLNSLLPPNSGWVLTDASAINDAGQIVGSGTYLGQRRSFLLTTITITADVNGDGKVDCTDVSIVKAGIGKKTGQPGFDPRADVNHDGVIDVRDLAIVTQYLPAGTACP